ncbi:MAG: GNAT family N-acetyltransferase [Propionibacteriaceae bacterium]|jgi:ribosomal protein S18 acetylase RimI-like enzyme|nr:GNAT family N-acetyltransferase [Propionibacteriaceae bacterium]
MPTTPPLTIRLATTDDIDLLIRVRQDFNDEWHPHSPAETAARAAQFRSYLAAHLSDNTFAAVLGFVATDLASTAFLLVGDYPSNCTIPHGRKATLINVYTYPAYRRQGYGEQVVTAAINVARTRGADVLDLEATDMARPLYHRLGFGLRPDTPMRFPL